MQQGNLKLEIPVWPLAVGSWSCPADWDAALTYSDNQDGYYVGANSTNSTDPCTITIANVGTTVTGTFSGALQSATSSITITNGTFSFPTP